MVPVSTRRTVASAILAWVVVVAVGSSAVWAVISRAGNGIAPTAEPVVEAPATTTTPGARPTGPTRSASPSPSPTGPTGPTGSTVERRTWQGTGGFVTAECRGATIALVAKSADPGFVVEERDVSAEEIRVTFEGQGSESREAEVRARCESGVPVFEASSGGSD